MSPLLRALKAKYRTPREALAALGLDQSLLDVSPPPNGASGAETPLAKLHSLLAQHFHGPEYSRVLELLEAANLSGHDYDRAVERKYNGEENEAEDNEVDEEELRQQRRKAMAKVADFFGRKGFSEDQIAEMLRDFPKNGLEHLGGALDKDHDEIMNDRRQRMATDARIRAEAYDAVCDHFPDARRIVVAGGTGC